MSGPGGLENQAPRRVSARHAEACATSGPWCKFAPKWPIRTLLQICSEVGIGLTQRPQRTRRKQGTWSGGTLSQICDEVGWQGGPATRRAWATSKAIGKLQKAKIKEGGIF